jgi:uncharacterized protein (DUF433 family)
MSPSVGSVQRSFRLSLNTSELLDASAELGSESRNALVDRLLGEALRTERHPLIRFRFSSTGRREPLVTGTRLLVRQVVATLRDNVGNIDDAAAYLEQPTRVVRAALSYYAEFKAEVDADAEVATRIEASERTRWEREQVPLA